MVENSNSESNPTLLDQYNLNLRGRIMVEATIAGSKGSTRTVKAPLTLLPIERVILTVLAFSQDREQTGYLLARKTYSRDWRDRTPSKFYNALKRLTEWEYVGCNIKGDEEESIGEGPYRKYNYITERGMDKLKKDYEMIKFES